MASYHLNVTPISRARGRSATACAAYRAAERIECEREGRCHDYTRKSGVLHAEIIAPEDAPDWVQDRASLWNGAEASENRKNSVVAREWRVALPAELDEAGRKELVMDFAHSLVDRFGIAADVAIHSPDREGDARNHHAHILTTTRRIGPEGFTEKTRELDDRKRGSVEIDAMRELWAEQQNIALEQVGSPERVDHRSLEAQRIEAEVERDALAERLERQEDHHPSPASQSDVERLREGLEQNGSGEREQGTEQDKDVEDRVALEAEHADAALRAEALDREPEVKLGIAANAIERKERDAAERQGREYEPRTERGAQVHVSRQARAMFGELRERLDLARETYATERDRGQDRISAGLEAIRAAAGRDRDGAGTIAERLAGILDRGKERETPERSIEDRLGELTGQRDVTPEPDGGRPYTISSPTVRKSLENWGKARQERDQLREMEELDKGRNAACLAEYVTARDAFHAADLNGDRAEWRTYRKAEDALIEAAVRDPDLYADAKALDDWRLTRDLVVAKFGEEGAQAKALDDRLKQSLAEDGPDKNPDQHRELVQQIARDFETNPAMAEFDALRGEAERVRTRERMQEQDYEPDNGYDFEL